MTTPAIPPATATAYLNLEQQSGWEKQAGPGIGSPGQPEPAVWDIRQTLPPPIQPPMTMTLSTTGVKGYWADWMAMKKDPPINPPISELNCLIRASYTFDNVQGIQAFEVGRRRTIGKITDNGQTQLVPITGDLLEFDIVPSAAGGWKDTGIRFPTFVAGTTYEEELYYVNDPDGALSLIYISLDGNMQLIPASLQHIAGASLGWNATVPAFQCDANPTGIPFNPVVKLSIWFW